MTRLCILLLLAGCPSPSAPPPPSKAKPAPPRERFAVGKAPSPDDLRQLPSVYPDGSGLPLGRGSVGDGARVYAARCAACHGVTGVEGPLDVLVGREPSEGYRLGARPPGATPVTIGNWWPRATSLFDYLRRAMPADAPGTLSDDEVYALCAFLLERNRIIAPDVVMDRTTLPSVKMPAAARFVVGD